MSADTSSAGDKKGIIAWMVNNRVTPNLIMLFLLFGGLFVSFQIKKEVFPYHETDWVTIRVAYPGSSPEEIEKGIVLAVEAAVRGLDGVKEITARANEGMGTVYVELLADAERQKVYQDIKQAVDRITTLPKDIERPVVSMAGHRRGVLNIALYGDVSERVLRQVVEQVQDRLLQDDRITQVDIRGAREYQIHIEVSQEKLRAHDLTLQEIANRIRAASIELPGGKIETTGGEVMLRVKDRRDWAREFARIPIVTTPNGSVLRLADLGQVKEGFEDADRFATYNGKPSMSLEVFRVGEQTPIGVSSAAREIMTQVEAELPVGVNWHISRDRSEIYQQRFELLVKNAFIGLVLVLMLLGLFLELRLAFWVTMGIPTSFLGAFLFLPGMDVSINIISMFAFIIALGIVVDDAIVAGENIYKYRTEGVGFIKAAIMGARDVAVPISFSILTNIVAFMPLYAVPGHMGKIWRVIPLVVVAVFAISWVESLLILPAHLGHSKKAPPKGLLNRLHLGFTRMLFGFVDQVYAPFLKQCIAWRYLTVAVFFAILLGVGGYVFGGRIGMILMPRVESDTAVVTAVLPFGSPVDKVTAVQDRLVKAMEQVAEENGREKLLEGIFSIVEESEVTVMAHLTPPKVRPLTTGQVTTQWREKTGQILGLESLRFESDRGGPGSGAALTVELSHWDIHMLDRASAALAEDLAEFPNVKDIDDGYTPGKQQLNFRIKEEGQSLGLTASEIGRQVRNAFYGAQALRQQRDRNEVRVLVRLPEADRASEYNVETLLITTPQGRLVPLRQVAEVIRGRTYTSIRRREARRTVRVTANVEPIGQTGQVKATLNRHVLPQLARDFPGLTYTYAGRQQHMKESTDGLYMSFIVALIVIYFLLAIPFRSYSQPLIVMVAIPFGIVGAVIGHAVMGYNLSLQSMMGMVALSGVVVNDSLILIDFANKKRKAGTPLGQAIREAGQRRFRPILLTTLTTFGGLSPMIFETSRQARFMIPMALSLGYGILFATAITLVLVPSLYMIIEDVLALVRRVRAA
ncbi:MAG: efflux RND transporter permease subunit [Myxococcota bacterium]|nr:efflux RND transporter permease subunit [Myxococcota bacterium]